MSELLAQALRKLEGGRAGRLSPGRLNPGRLSPGRLSPGRLSPGRLSPGRLSPGRLSTKVRAKYATDFDKLNLVLNLVYGGLELIIKFDLLPQLLVAFKNDAGCGQKLVKSNSKTR